MLRRAARVLVVDPSDRLLLLPASDPQQPELGRWWFTPGGGRDPGERNADAARRELWEETGYRAGRLGAVVARRSARFHFQGTAYDQREVYYLLRTPAFTPRAAAPSPVELRLVGPARWWPLEDLERAVHAGQRVFPTHLVRLTRRVLAASAA